MVRPDFRKLLVTLFPALPALFPSPACAPPLRCAHPPSEVSMTRMTWFATARGAAFCRAARSIACPLMISIEAFV